jgi:hypothetical protein
MMKGELWRYGYLHNSCGCINSYVAYVTKLHAYSHACIFICSRILRLVIVYSHLWEYTNTVSDSLRLCVCRHVWGCKWGILNEGRYSRRQLANVISISGDEQFTAMIVMLKFMETYMQSKLSSIETFMHEALDPKLARTERVLHSGSSSQDVDVRGRSGHSATGDKTGAGESGGLTECISGVHAQPRTTTQAEEKTRHQQANGADTESILHVLQEQQKQSSEQYANILVLMQEQGRQLQGQVRSLFAPAPLSELSHPTPPPSLSPSRPFPFPLSVSVCASALNLHCGIRLASEFGRVRSCKASCSTGVPAESTVKSKSVGPDTKAT